MFTPLEPDGPAFFSITGVREGNRIRALGEYVDREEIEPYVPGEESDSLASVSEHLVKSIICSGVRPGPWGSNLVTHGRHSKRPEDYQLLPMDLLDSPWLDILVPGKFPRTRLLVADEGGLGKTFAASLAIANTFYDHGGVIIVMSPPTLRLKWKSEIRSVMRTRAQDVRVIYARQLRKNMEEGVYIVSKHAIAHRFQDDPHEESWIPDSELCVVDEAHQGTLGSGENKLLFSSLRKICKNSRRVISLTASPFHHGVENLLSVFEMIGGETEASVESLRARLFDNGWQSSFEAWNDQLNLGSDLVGGNEEDVKIWISDTKGELQRMLGWMETEDVSQIIHSLSEKGPRIISENHNGQGHRLLRDLHPLGRFFSIVQRADLGPDAGRLFRNRIDEFHRIELHPDHEKLVASAGESSIENPENARRIVASWADNARDTARYSFIKVPPGCQMPSDDPRWQFVIRQIENELDLFLNESREKSRGVVIFVDFIGTLSKMKKDIESIFSQKSVEVVGVFGELENKEKVRMLARGHEICSNGRLPIFICTSSAEVGVDMDWATLGIMWDINSNPETLSQRGWRLDRRHDMNRVAKVFRIIHIQNNHNMERVHRMNNSHSMSSAILGRGANDKLIPHCVSSPILRERSWPSKRGVFALSSEEAKKIHSRFDPEVQAKDTQSDLEILLWSWISNLTGLRIDLDDAYNRGFLSLDDSAFNRDEPSRGIAESQIKIIWDLSSIASLTEMACLWKISGTPIDVNGNGAEKHRLGLQFASHGKEHRHGVSTINSLGPMASRLRKSIIEDVIGGDLIKFGSGAPYLSWITYGYSPIEGTSILVEPNWLELWSSHQHWLEKIGVPSPLIICQEESVEFLEESEDWKETIGDAIEFLIDVDGLDACLFYGKAPPSEAEWPTLSPSAVIKMRDKINMMISHIQTEIKKKRNPDGSRPSGARALRTALNKFHFSEHGPIPLMCFSGGH